MTLEEQLASLRAWLRHHDIEATTSQLSAATQLLLTHGLSFDTGTAPALARILRPVFAKNVKDQRRFEALLSQWLQQVAPQRIAPPPIPDDPIAFHGGQIGHPPGQWRWLLIGVLLLVALVVLRLSAQERVLIRASQDAGPTPAPYADFSLGPCQGETDAYGYAQCLLLWHQLPSAASIRFQGQVRQVKIDRWRQLLTWAAPYKMVIQFSPPAPEPAVRLGGQDDLDAFTMTAHNVPPPPTVPRVPAKSAPVRERVITSSLIFLVLGAAFVYWIRRSASVSRGLRDVMAPVEWLFGSAPAVRHSVAKDMRRVAEGMRNLETFESRWLNVRASAAATMRAAGLFQGVYTNRRERRFVVLIERWSLQDHHARIGLALAEQCREAGADVTVYRFTRDPAVLEYVPKPGRLGGRPRRSQRSMAAAISDHKGSEFILICDPGSLVDRIRPELTDWARSLQEAAGSCVVLTMVPASQTRRARRTLLPARIPQITVEPGTLFGLPEAARWASGRAGVHTRRALESDVDFFYPASLRSPAAAPPAPHVVRDFLAAMKAYLGEDGYRWLQACAVYPDVNWSVTTALGNLLVAGSEERRESILLRMCGLVWFRTAQMPDWLRTELVAGIAPDHMTKLRRFYWGLFVKSADADSFSLSLTHASLRHKLAAWWKRLRLVTAAEHTPVMRERMFVRFLLGRQPSSLDMGLSSQALRQLQGATRSGWMYAGSTAMVVAMTGAFLIFPSSVPATQVEEVRDLDIAIDGGPARVYLASVDGNLKLFSRQLAAQSGWAPNFVDQGSFPSSILEARISLPADVLGVIYGEKKVTIFRRFDQTRSRVLSQPSYTRSLAAESPPRAVAFSPEGARAIVMVGNNIDFLRIHTVKDSEKRGQDIVNREEPSWELPLAIHSEPDARVFLGISDNGAVAVVATPNSMSILDVRKRQALPMRPLRAPPEGKHQRTALAVHTGPGQAITDCFDSGLVRTWVRSSSGQALEVLRNQVPSCTAIAVHPSGSFAAIGGANGEIRLLYLGAQKDSTLVHTSEGGSAPVIRIAFSNDGKHLVVLRRDHSITWIEFRKKDSPDPLKTTKEYPRHFEEEALAGPAAAGANSSKRSKRSPSPPARYHPHFDDTEEAQSRPPTNTQRQSPASSTSTVPPTSSTPSPSPLPDFSREEGDAALNAIQPSSSQDKELEPRPESNFNSPKPPLASQPGTREDSAR